MAIGRWEMEQKSESGRTDGCLDVVLANIGDPQVVAELIDPTTKTWNEQLPSIMFDVPTVQEILAVPLGISTWSDKQI